MKIVPDKAAQELFTSGDDVPMLLKEAVWLIKNYLDAGNPITVEYLPDNGTRYVLTFVPMRIVVDQYKHWGNPVARDGEVLIYNYLTRRAYILPLVAPYQYQADYIGKCFGCNEVDAECITTVLNGICDTYKKEIL